MGREEVGCLAIESPHGPSSAFRPPCCFPSGSRRRGELFCCLNLLGHIDLVFVHISQGATITNPDTLKIAVAQVADDHAVLNLVEMRSPERTNGDACLARYATRVVYLGLATDPITGSGTGRTRRDAGSVFALLADHRHKNVLEFVNFDSRPFGVFSATVPQRASFDALFTAVAAFGVNDQYPRHSEYLLPEDAPARGKLRPQVR